MLENTKNWGFNYVDFLFCLTYVYFNHNLPSKSFAHKKKFFIKFYNFIWYIKTNREVKLKKNLFKVRREKGKRESHDMFILVQYLSDS